MILYFFLLFLVNVADGASLLRQVADVLKIKENRKSRNLVNATFSYLFEPLIEEDALFEIKSVDDANRAADWAIKRRRVAFHLRFDGGAAHPKFSNYTYRIGQFASPKLDAFCTFFKYTIPKLRVNVWPKAYLLISVGTIGLGSPWHPSIRKALQKADPSLCPQEIFTKEPDSLLQFIENENKILYYLISQHWPQSRDTGRDDLSPRQIYTWDPAKSLTSWHFLDHATTKNIASIKANSCISTSTKLIQVPLGYKWQVRAKSLAFDHVFLAATNAAFYNIHHTQVEDPFFQKRNLSFDSDLGSDDVHRPTLVKSAMRLHKGRAEKLRAFQRHFFSSTSKRGTATNVRAAEFSNYPNNQKIRSSTTTTKIKELQNMSKDSPMEYTQKAAGVYDDFLNYYTALATSKFVLSPVGTGLDCYRHWEALALGAIPIVDYSPVTAVLFKDLPVLLLDNWDLPLSHAHYESFYHNFITYAGHTFNFQKLTTTYWQNWIKLFLFPIFSNASGPQNLVEERAKSTIPTFIPSSRCSAGPFLATCSVFHEQENRNLLGQGGEGGRFRAGTHQHTPFTIEKPTHRCRAAHISDRLDISTLVLMPTAHEHPGGRRNPPPPLFGEPAVARGQQENED
uniref:RXYLT1 C-terminal domain-containing protein n=1 Tax=Aureoumbra lagunensis TaxID=44058 RepID=A0A7S3NNZ7_9STRA|mmetsp:Transcript_17230/g.25955  ORF Transcript_17230/g.25955 Transcript_17230/m.25955 type:complete len:624 (-) Transcript_17230:73-1944(-)